MRDWLRRRVQRHRAERAAEGEVSRAMRNILRPFKFALTVVMVLMFAVVAVGFVTVAQANNKQDENRVEDAVASCNRGNEGRHATNAIVDAVALGREIKLRQSQAERDQAQFLIDALTGGRELTPEQQARADDFLGDIDASQDVIDGMLEDMAVLIDLARRPIRDCDPAVVLQVPEVTVREEG